MALSLAEKRGSWVYLFPVSGLVLTDAVNEEFRIHRVTLVSVRRLARVRKRLGLPRPLSAIRKQFPWVDFLKNDHAVVAIVRETGKPQDIDTKARRLVMEALQILSASQLGWSRRRSNAFPSIDGSHISPSQHISLNTKTLGGISSGQLQGKFGELTLSGRWVNYHKRVFFWRLLRILHGDIPVDKSWRRTLRNVAALIGQSLTTNDLAHAFLLDMIAIEALLTVQGDKCVEALPERVEAFIGWVGYWHTSDYENRIRELYRKRCKYVHDADASTIEVSDLLFLDDIVLNVLANLVAHTSIFSNKGEVIDFARRVSAEHVLGISGKHSKVRPKTLRHWARRYSEADLRRI